MPVQKVSIESFSADIEDDYSECVINFDGKKAVLEFRWDESLYIYEGREAAKTPGKYELRCATSKGRATLYRLPGNEKAYCHWRDPDHVHGIWEIDLEEDDQFLK